jgi:hypothetical protein
MSKAISLCLLVAAALVCYSFSTMMTVGDEFMVNRATNLRADASER